MNTHTMLRQFAAGRVPGKVDLEQTRDLCKGLSRSLDDLCIGNQKSLRKFYDAYSEQAGIIATYNRQSLQESRKGFEISAKTVNEVNQSVSKLYGKSSTNGLFASSGHETTRGVEQGNDGRSRSLSRP